MDFTDTNDIYKTKAGNGGNVDISKFLQKLVMKRNRETELESFKKASPYWRIQENDCIPRIMVVHGTVDTLVPYEDGRIFYKQLTKKRVEELKQTKKLEGIAEVTMDESHNPVDIFVKLPSTHHAFNFVVSPRTLALGDAVVDFINHIYKEEFSSKL